MRNTLPKTKPAASPITGWKQFDWSKIRKYVDGMQQRIYRAESLGRKRTVRNLQRILMHSKAALLLSIKRITQDNRGKRTAGIDGNIVANDSERIMLYEKMKKLRVNQHNPKPSYRIYIKKKNGKLRPLSIPTIMDRVWQNAVKLALEPQWEYHFESTSYGFRPGRGCHDAIERIFQYLVFGKRRWIFEGDFKGCFDNLNHTYIMKQIQRFPAHKLIHKWLEAGYVDNGTFHLTDAGSGQGSILSPLIANIALHGMEDILGIKYYINKNAAGRTWAVNTSKYAMTRYADDFVIMCYSKEDAEAVYSKLTPYLKERGLELEENKIRVIDISEGFDFLGFNVRRYPASSKDKLLIKPSKDSIKKFRQKVADTVKDCYGHNVEVLIRKLNPIIRGTANYWKAEVSSKVFSAMDKYIVNITYRFLAKTHHNKNHIWIKKRYFRKDIRGISKNRWILSSSTQMNLQLIKMSWTHIERHILIKFKASPFNSNLSKYFYYRKRKESNQTFGEQVCLSCMS